MCMQLYSKECLKKKTEKVVLEFFTSTAAYLIFKATGYETDHSLGNLLVSWAVFVGQVRTFRTVFKLVESNETFSAALLK